MSYGKLHQQFWTDPKIRGLSIEGKLLATYLISSPHRNLIGCYRLPIGYICDDLEWTPDRVAVVLTELAAGERPFIVRDKDGWTHIVNSLKYDGINGPNHFKSAAKLIEIVPHDSPVFGSLAPRLAEIWNSGIPLPRCLARYLPSPSEPPLMLPEPPQKRQPDTDKVPTKDLRTPGPVRSHNHSHNQENGKLDKFIDNPLSAKRAFRSGPPTQQEIHAMFEQRGLRFALAHYSADHYAEMVRLQLSDEPADKIKRKQIFDDADVDYKARKLAGTLQPME